jgi:hypothetical protein
VRLHHLPSEPCHSGVHALNPSDVQIQSGPHGFPHGFAVLFVPHGFAVLFFGESALGERLEIREQDRRCRPTK